MSETETTPRVNPRKVREGLVLSTKMDKTAVVATVGEHPLPRLRAAGAKCSISTEIGRASCRERV